MSYTPSQYDMEIMNVFFFSEVNSGFFYKSAAEREKLVQAEREFIDERVRKIIALKKQVCEGNNKSFYVINQKVGTLLSLYRDTTKSIGQNYFYCQTQQIIMYMFYFRALILCLWTCWLKRALLD